jgi:hypothetical protein
MEELAYTCTVSMAMVGTCTHTHTHPHTHAKHRTQALSGATKTRSTQTYPEEHTSAMGYNTITPITH